MPDSNAVSALRSLGGITRTVRLTAVGATEHAMRRAVADGTIIRPRHGLVALITTPRPILAAAAAGGSLSCVAAAAYYGFWTPRDQRLHVSIQPNARTMPTPAVVFHRDAHHLTGVERFVVSPQTCVAQCIRELPFDHAVALLDSARHGERTRSAGFPALDLSLLAAVLPRRLHRVLSASDPRAESGAESIARVRLARAGMEVRPQQWVTRDIRVDLLIGHRLVVEIGSTTFHAAPEQYEKDHDRATTLLALGFDLIEFTTRQVMDDWADVEAVISNRARQLKSE